MNAKAAACPGATDGDEDDARWQAVLAREARARDRFVYAVNSTGVFCRPTCPARRPKRAHVRFFATAQAAEAAGFRPCLRCRPLDPAAEEERAALIARLCARLATDEPPTLAALAAEAGLSPWHLQRLFRAHVGLGPKQYALACRARRLRQGLQDAASVTHALYDAGFNSSGRFYAQADATLGMTPRQWRREGAGERIRFALAATAEYGALLVACSSRGVCAIEFGDDAETLVAGLSQRFPRAEIIADDPALADAVAAVLAHLALPRGPLDLPLDIRGTAFQHRVWHALRAIEPGRTVSYRELAEALGRPTAARAVARACAANTLAVAIPCHRVVGGDGALTGFRWGIERKRRLLARERALAGEKPVAGDGDRKKEGAD